MKIMRLKIKFRVIVIFAECRLIQTIIVMAVRSLFVALACVVQLSVHADRTKLRIIDTR